MTDDLPKADKPLDTRVLTLILFYALRREVEQLDEDEDEDFVLDDQAVRNMIVRGLNYLPGVRAEPDVTSDRSSFILVEGLEEATEPQRMNIQDAIDSIGVLWRDYNELIRRPEPQARSALRNLKGR